MAQAFDVGLAGKEVGVGEWTVKSSPKAVSAAAEYLPPCLEPTVVPSASLK